jgi:hypothetical protein
MDEDNDPHSDEYYFYAGCLISVGMGILVAVFLYMLNSLL